MSTRLYPLYQRGNPQLRVFLTNFWMKVVRPEYEIPKNMVHFQTSIEMTDHDVKSYLEKIYKLPVLHVKTEIKMGKTRRTEGNGYVVKDDDYKIAEVVFPKDFKFEFPDLFPEKDKEEERQLKQIKLESKGRKAKLGLRPGVPSWFS